MGVKIREKKLTKGAKSFYLDCYHEGKRFYEFTGIKIHKNDTSEDKKEKKILLESIRAKKELELISEGTNFIPKHKKNIKFFDYASNYLNNYKKADIRMIKSSITKFHDFTSKNKKNNLKVKDITSSLLENFILYLKNDANLDGETPNNYFARFKKILNQAEKDQILKNSNHSNIHFKKEINDDLRKNILTRDELQALALAECGNDQVKKAFLFACFTGLGLKECRLLKWEHIKNNRVVINRLKTKQKINNILRPNTLKLIGERKDNNDLVFKLSEKDISNNAINKNIKYWTERAKINKKITFYCARHTFATQLLLNGANLKTVADAMAHSSTKSTIKYLNYIDSLKDDAIKNLPNIDL